MSTNQQESNGATRVAYLLGVPLAGNVVRQWTPDGKVIEILKPGGRR